jgi:hypothetical protein
MRGKKRERKLKEGRWKGGEKGRKAEVELNRKKKKYSTILRSPNRTIHIDAGTHSSATPCDDDDRPHRP